MYIMGNVNPDQIPNIRYENENSVLYLFILKDSYGFNELDLLWYELDVNTLK